MGVDGKEYTMATLSKDADLVVVCFTCNQCPVAVAYEDRFIEFCEKYKDKNVSFVALNCNNRTENLDVMKQRAEEKGFNFIYAFDESGKAAKEFGARVTPEMFVVKDGKIAYHGAFDNKQTEPTEMYLVSAVNALLDGKTPEKAETKPFGCGIKAK
jgi:peroxiredoxin